MAKAKNTIRIDFVFGTLIGHKEFTTQESATKFCEFLYKKKFESTGLKFSDLYGRINKFNNSQAYGSHVLYYKKWKLEKEKFTSFPLKVTVSHL